MKKQNGYKKKTTVEMIPEYGQQKLIKYAESFHELAGLIACGKEPPAEDYELCKESDRQMYLLRCQQNRNRMLLSDQLGEMAHIMKNVAKESYDRIPISERRFRMIYRALRQVGVEMKDLFRFENEDGHIEIGLVMRARGKDCVTVEDVAGLLSVALNDRLLADKDGPVFVSRDFSMFHFYEEPGFYVITGSARAVKESEKVSGDNFSFYEMDKGHMFTLLSDGTGSGLCAGDASDHVLGLVQKLLEAGFAKEKAVQILNGSMDVQNEEQNMPTLDICDINLYTGGLELLKMGASCTYIKREYMIDRISSDSLPLGACSSIMPQAIHRELTDGDYVIMLSDGVIDAVARGMGEDMFPEFLGSLTCTNPTEMAGQILNYSIRECKGQIKDDMTVLVTGLWENTM